MLLFLNAKILFKKSTHLWSISRFSSLGDPIKSKMSRIEEIDAKSNYSNNVGNFESGKMINT